MRVIFSHGKESGPWGTKIKVLAATAQRFGFAVESIDYRGMQDPDERVTKLVSHLDGDDNVILVGSSMGGYVALLAAAEVKSKAVFLLVPALYMPGYEGKDYPVQQANVSIVHGWNDEIISYQNSLRYAEQNKSALHLIEDGHRLVEKLGQIEQIFEEFLSRFTA